MFCFCFLSARSADTILILLSQRARRGNNFDFAFLARAVQRNFDAALLARAVPNKSIMLLSWRAQRGQNFDVAFLARTARMNF